VKDDVDAAGFDEIVLVGHSLAGCSLPATIGLLGVRVRHAVFVACTVPENGQSAFDTLSFDIQAHADSAHDRDDPGVLDQQRAKAMFGNDLTDEQFAWCCERMVPESLNLVSVRDSAGRVLTWVKAMAPWPHSSHRSVGQDGVR
jgi:hypothetical protein